MGRTRTAPGCTPPDHIPGPLGPRATSADRRGSAGPLTSQSPLLARLAREPRGTRIADPLRNLPMLVGLAPISAYRTLNLPAVEALTRARDGADERPRVRAAGPVGVAGDRDQLAEYSTPWRTGSITCCGGPNTPARRSRIRPWPAGSTAPRGRPSKGTGCKQFSIWRCDEPPVRAWFLPLTADRR